ncbi:phenylacetate--CoA ligase family protein [Hypericibacter terrae]|jgi:phenylacetate-CoA ligase|uniref:phenylacetate--CoA ligase family protein n=1 Tax=Hypericibacter terrae TaxID=2602015 RepID=UPI001245FD18|nr:phenylacetate--CoA ligase family protein [Hypericibacter terrae]
MALNTRKSANDLPLPPPGTPVARMMHRLQHRLQDSQWWRPERLRQAQFEQLKALLRHAAATIPFYAERLQQAGFHRGMVLDEASWSQLPVLTRPEVQAAGNKLLSKDLPEHHGRRHEIRTSGSTGQPVRIVTSDLAQTWFRAVGLREALWQQRDFSGFFAVIRKFERSDMALPPDGEDLPRWGDQRTYPFPTGKAARLSLLASVAQQADWLMRKNPHYLLTYPSNLAALAQYCGDAGMRPSNLRQVLSIAELLPPETRTLVRETWGVSIADVYSCKEIGYLALQCPARENHLHVQSETVLLEVLDEQGRACRPGEVGRVVVTPLFNFAMPLLRYAVGDYAKVGALCDCGRGLPVLEQVQGRVRNMLTTPDGGRYWPSFGSRRFREIAPIRQHQFVQKSLQRLQGRLAVERPLTPEEETTLRAHILTRLPIPFEIDFVYVDEIPISAAGKLENFISEIDNPPPR